MRLFLFGFLFVFLSSCTTIQSISVSSFQPSNEAMVKASDKERSFFGLFVPTLEVSRKLREQCPNGSINGVQTTLTVQNAIIVQTYEITAIGYCTKK